MEPDGREAAAGVEGFYNLYFQCPVIANVWFY